MDNLYLTGSFNVLKLYKLWTYTLINCGLNETKITGDIQLNVSSVSLSQWDTTLAT